MTCQVNQFETVEKMRDNFLLPSWFKIIARHIKKTTNIVKRGLTWLKIAVHHIVHQDAAASILLVFPICNDLVSVEPRVLVSDAHVLRLEYRKTFR